MTRHANKAAIMAFLVGLIGLAPSLAKSQQTITAATFAYEPFAYTGTDGELTGLAIDIFKALGKGIERHIDVVIIENNDAAEALASGRVDMTLMFEHPEFAAFAARLGPVFEVSGGVCARERITSYAALRSLRIGHLTDMPFNRRFDTDTHLNKVAFANVAGMLAALTSNKIDAIAGPLQLLMYQEPEIAVQLQGRCHRFEFDDRKLWLYVRTKAFVPSEITALDDTIVQLRETRMIDRMRNHYLFRRAGQGR